jgi:acyl-[acyl carrier protein]--UDP-N-acetylglucosamine O-acyltransferase
MTSVIHPTAKLGAGVTLGEFCVIGPNVTLGEGCKLGHHVVIHADTVVGANVRIDDHASLGKVPMRAANSATTKEQDLPPLTIGDVSIVGTGVCSTAAR